MVDEAHGGGAIERRGALPGVIPIDLQDELAEHHLDAAGMQETELREVGTAAASGQQGLQLAGRPPFLNHVTRRKDVVHLIEDAALRRLAEDSLAHRRIDQDLGRHPRSPESQKIPRLLQGSEARGELGTIGAEFTFAHRPDVK